MALLLVKDVGIPNVGGHINDYTRRWSGGLLR